MPTWIGFDRPFTVIGERINPTGRKKLAAEMQAGNFDTVIKDALAQIAAGAHILDVNAGVTAVNPNESEPPLMRQTLEIVQSITDLPLCIDSSVTSALKAGPRDRQGPPAGQFGDGRGRKARGHPAAGRQVQCRRRRDLE
jgi:5-methyltetrahydrofolate--homocysteine methyltransferase